MIPYRDNVPRVYRPVVTVGLIAANVLIFLWVQALPPWAHQSFVHIFGVVPATFSSPDWAARHGLPDVKWISLFTYQFLHSGWLHIIFNMWMLWIFGDNVEDVTGHLGFLAFYLLCGLAAAGVQIMADTASPVPMIGASGAIGGVMGAYFLLYPHGKVYTFIPIFFFPLIIKLPAVLFLGVWFVMQFISGMAGSLTPGEGSVAFWAHTGGFVAGVLLIPVFRRKNRCRYCYNPESRDYDPF